LILGVKTGARGLGLIGFVFPEPEGVVYFHNPLLNRSYVHFGFLANWLCIGFVLGLFWLCFFIALIRIFLHNPL